MLDALLATLAPTHLAEAKPTTPPPPPHLTARQTPQPLASPTTEAPTKLPPESKPAAIAPPAVAPTPVVTPTPSPARTPTPAPTPAPRSVETDTATAARLKARAAQLKLLEEKLAAIVARDKPQKQAQLRRNLQTSAINQAQSGQLQQARQTARDWALTPAEQAELLTQINQIKGSTTTARARVKSPTQTVARLPRSSNPVRASATTPPAYTPSYVLPNGPRVPGLSDSIRLLRPTWQLGNGNLRLIFPLPIPVLFSSGFGWRNHPITGDRRFHRGIDLAAALGTPVVAAFSGMIEAADWMDGYGLTVLISHPNATQTLYAHLSEIFVKPGDRITQGQPIGRVGSTGNSTGPHLHFELHQLTEAGWEAIDPELALEVARVHLAKVLQDPATLPVTDNSRNPTAKPLPPLPHNFGAIPPPPTQKFPILHNF